VHALKAQKREVLTYQWQQNGTNLPPNGVWNSIQGPTTNSTLYFTNCTTADTGVYTCIVSDTNGSIRSVPVPLTVTLPPCPTVNRLSGNAGFEYAPSWAPWQRFNGAYFVSTNNFYDISQTTPVNIFDGKWCAMVGENGDRDNGFLQAIKGVTPGSVWKAGGWAYISSANDFAGGNTCLIQISFRDASGNSVPSTPIYESFKIYGLAYANDDMTYCCIDQSSPNYGGCVLHHDMLPRDQWCYLPVTNMVNNYGTGLQDDLPTNTVPEGCFMDSVGGKIVLQPLSLKVASWCRQTQT
jgi:hypothetical protein